MNRRSLLPVLVIACVPLAFSDPAQAPEVLQYNINWPSGLSLGEARLTTAPPLTPKDRRQHREMKLEVDAALPGFPIQDQYISRMAKDGCSAEFEKHTVHGSRKADESLTFDRSAGRVTRKSLTPGGGKSESSFTGCPRDGLAYLEHLRKELALGRVPQPQTVYAGAPYKVSLRYKMTRTMVVAGEPVQADVLLADIVGPKSKHTIEVAVGKDPARTILQVQVPFDMGTFSMELAR